MTVDLETHPTVRAARARPRRADAPPDRDALVTLALEAGADDAGVVGIDRPEIADQRAAILEVAPWAKSLVAYVCRANRDPIRSPARSVANLEFHHTGDRVNETGAAIVRALEARGRRAVNPAMGFPMEMENFGTRRQWVVSHKPVAEAAGLGTMGIHRSVIHPEFGSFVLLGTIVTDVDLETDSAPLDYNPCLECKLCVAACPVGAIKPDGAFDFSACYTHNYRDFMGGFGDWVETVVEAADAEEYRERVRQEETMSMWQSLSFGANYKAAYCVAVCPAGEDVIGPWLESRKAHLDDIVRPLTEKVEPVYVVPGSDAEAHVRRRFPHKSVRTVGNGLRAGSIRGFADGMRLTFQRGRAEGLEATYHFRFHGRETGDLTVRIADGALAVDEGLHGDADLVIEADTDTWLGFLAREKSLVWALLLRRIRLRGSIRLLRAVGRCFPG